jgi:hypothetical protein
VGAPPLVPVACPLDAVLEECVDQALRHGGLLVDVVRVLLGHPLRRFLVVERGVARTALCGAVASIAVASVVGGAGALGVRRALATVGAARAAIASQVLRRELLGETVGIEALLEVLRLEVSLLALILGLLVRILEVASAVALAIAVLCTPDLLLPNRLRERRGRGGKCSPAVVLVPVTASTAKVQLKPIDLLVVAHCECGRERLGASVDRGSG